MMYEQISARQFKWEHITNICTQCLKALVAFLCFTFGRLEEFRATEEVVFLKR